MVEWRKNWVQNLVTVLGMFVMLLMAYTAMSNESAVRGEQIRTIQNKTRCLQADGEKQEVRIRNVELDANGLKGSVKAVKVIAESNARKLDTLLLRGK